MKILIINEYLGYGSTGKIVLDLAKKYDQMGNDVKVAFGRRTDIPEDSKKYAIQVGKRKDVLFHALYTRLTDKHGLASKTATKKFLKWAEDFSPEFLWIHNIHGYFINYELLFDWIKSRPQMKVKWTLHDCWTFTGHCAHYTYLGCQKWKRADEEKSHCGHCPQLNQYPASFFDNSADNYMRKKRAFLGVKDMTIITPSKWLQTEVSKSFLSEYPIEVMYNKINSEVFKPLPNDFKEKHGLSGKKMILGVASAWNERKGLYDYITLSGMLKSDYAIVLVGLAQKQIEEVHKKNQDIIALPKTGSAKELAEIYSAADVFVNLTYEDTFPTVNLEAEACGTPVITFDTGGCSETISGKDSIAVPQELHIVKEKIYSLLEG